MAGMTVSTTPFPLVGCSRKELERQLDELASLDLDVGRQRMFTHMHKGSDDVHDVCRATFNRYFHDNSFCSPYQAGQRQMQDEVLSMTVDLFNGAPDGRANLTTGGSESIFCAVHAAREWAKATRPDILSPYQVIVPWTVHPAFDKAAHYLGLDCVRIPMRADYRADPAAMEAAVTPHTLMLVGSAPCWGLGLVDPIPELAAIAEARGLWMHTDACVGGYLLPFMERLGVAMPAWDFRVPGVCSISADLHKHGYAPKPCSTVSFRSEALQAHHWVPVDDWQSGLYLSQGMAGSRPFASTAAAWAIMTYLGIEGYLESTRVSLAVQARLSAGIESIADFEVLRNQCLLTPFRSNTLNMNQVFAGVIEKGYFPFGTFNPAYLHPAAEPFGDEVVDTFLADLADIADGVQSGRITEEAFATYGS